MNFKERCIQELDEGRLFENSGHRTRFKDQEWRQSNGVYFRAFQRFRIVSISLL